MQIVRYVKAFSKGQITIPKEIRKNLGMGDDFWLKMTVENGKIIAEPAEKKISNEEYQKKLLRIKGDWFDPKEHDKIRQEVEDRLKKSSL